MSRNWRWNIRWRWIGALGLIPFVLRETLRALQGKEAALELFRSLRRAQVESAQRRFYAPHIRTCSISEIFPNIHETVIQVRAKTGPLLSDAFPPHGLSLLFRQELFLIAAIAKHLRPKRVFEFGTCRGGTALNLAINAGENVEVISLDIATQVETEGQLQAWINSGKIRLLIGDSTTMNLSSYRKSCDLIFIDGGHEEVVVRADTHNALEMLTPGGVLIWHDVTTRWPSVSQVVMGLARHHRIVRLQGTRLGIFIKP